MNKSLSFWELELLTYLILLENFSKYANMKKELYLGQFRILKMTLMHD